MITNLEKNEIEPLTNMTDWTHIKDFTPSRDGRYLVALTDGSVEIGAFYQGGLLIGGKNEWFMDRDSDIQITNVTHWAQLPNHPEAK